MSRSNAILLFAFVAIATGPRAFSADPTPGTTNDIDPATGLSRSTVVQPLRDAAPPYAPAPGTPVAVPQAGAGQQPATAGPHIALILPTASPTLGRVADALRLGFVAAATAGDRNAPPVVVTAVSDDGPALLEACRRSQTLGAVIVVTGLTRDGATAVAQSDCPRIPVLTLNQPQQGNPPAQLYSISLGLEQEARQAALLAVADGWRSAIVVTSASALSQRVQEAFEREWSRAAGEVAGRMIFDGSPEQAGAIKDRIENLRGEIVFLALGQAGARAVRPYIPAILPVYATSLSVDPRAEGLVNLDLQGMRYVDMPWFVQPDHPAVMVYPAPPAAMSVEQERLYALGIDAYRLANMLLQGDPGKLVLDGVTGRITLEAANHFARALSPAEVDGGKVVPLKAP